MTALEWIAVLADVATIVIALAILLVALALLVAAWNSRKLVGAARRIGDRLQEDTRPIVRNLTNVADNVNYIAASVREDVEGIKGTIRRQQERLEGAAATMERRIQEFNALLGVVQEEAEQIFVDTASTVRGVRAGARTLRGGPAEGWDEETEVLAPPARVRGEAPHH